MKQVAGDPMRQRAQASGNAGNNRNERDEGSVGMEGRRLRAGLLGRGIQESRSPRMHEAEGARLGLRYEYSLIDFDRLDLPDSDLPRLLTRLRAEGFAGVNITHPFKECVVTHLDRLAPDAEAIGAVNTVVFRDEGMVGYNTDCWGFAESFRRGLRNPRVDEVVLIGAGGAGMAVARALVDLGVRRLAIFDTDTHKAMRLSATIGAGTTQAAVAADLVAAIESVDGVVNATPVGMAKYPGLPLDPRSLRSDLWVADIVYFPAETDLLHAATAAGCQTLPGAGMAIFQAVKAFELITQMEPNANEMARHFRA